MNKNQPIVVGIHWAHDASVSVCSPEGVLFSIQEERINRLKHYYGFPCRALEEAMQYCGLTPLDITAVAFTSHSVFFPEHRNSVVLEADGKEQIGGPFYTIEQLRQMRQKRQDRIRETWEPEFVDRHYSMKLEYMEKMGLMDERIVHYYISHHRAHAASAFRLSGFQEACIISIDGKGDGLSATIYKGYRNGHMEMMRSSKAADSLGSFYQAITEALGFIPVDGEYKTMGLAALGREDTGENPFDSTVCVENGVFRSKIQWTFRNFNQFNPQKRVPNPLGSVAETEQYKKILNEMSREQFAYFAQKHCEENMLKYARDAMQITGSDNIAAAGGVMLNVKANARIRDELKPAEFFVFPDSADSGLSAGAAMDALFHLRHLEKNCKFYFPYQGLSFTQDEIATEIEIFKNKQALSITDCGNGTPKAVARKLVEGKVIGTFQGRLEMGPRALGNRSVLADARTDKVKDRINLILKGREWFVPFAPIVLQEDAHLYWDGNTDYRYMTFSVKANEYAKKNVPGVVHVDGTMRPQVVSRDFNPWLYQVLTEYKALTDIGVLINTSFNRHGLPIVGAPHDALEHLVNQWIDGLVIGNYYMEKQ